MSCLSPTGLLFFNSIGFESCFLIDFFSVSSEIVRHWRLKEQRYGLAGEICQNAGCGKKLFPPRDLCPHCGQPASIEHNFSGKGKVYSYTVVYDAPSGFENQTPYVVALVKLEEGPMVIAQLTDLETYWKEKMVNGSVRRIMKFKVNIGMPVEMVTRKLKEEGKSGIIVYGYKFRPLFSPEQGGAKASG